jgi:probable F420-dependent oxidoreductase
MGIGIGVGLAEFPFSNADAFWEWVEQCETLGIDSIWQTDRLISSEPYLEVMSVMAALAGRTKRLKFGMNVASVGQRDPVVLAKECATIDMLSNGRLLPAFGIGSPAGAYWDATGRVFKGIGKRSDEALDVIARLWREEHVTYDGEFYQLKDATISPRPAQKRIPFWIGGSSKPAIRRTARIGTGWLAGRETPAEVATVVAAIKVAVKEAGRTIDEDHYGASFHYRFGSWDEDIAERQGQDFTSRSPGKNPRDHLAVGDAGDIIRRIEDYIDAGIAKFVLRPIGADDAEIMAQTRLLADEVLPAFADRPFP